ncbi:hypothetical protein L1987_75184 [Smallanthus sonchifolius]|uniref:Uncharacterized protein n=1 Tax=Smallanthus sonchifolius TaxID=185202 RepID=A0ACB9A403_9ASTR|nr:hypothetical protein L1987_75184 [Smallanthus sonchifolius]
MSKALSPALRPLDLEDNKLAQYESSSFPTTIKKYKFWRARFSKKSVHLIPLILFFCAIVLWFFSNPMINTHIDNDFVAALWEVLQRDDHEESCPRWKVRCAEVEGEMTRNGVLRGIAIPIHKERKATAHPKLKEMVLWVA